MSIWSRMFGGRTSGNSTVAVVPSAMAMAQSVHDAGSRAPRTKHWDPPAVTNVTVAQSAKTIRDRSRAAWRNDSYARGGIERLVSSICGTGIKPLSQSPSSTFRRQVHEAWYAWTEQAGAGQTRSFEAVITAAVREWLVSGESWIRLRTRRTEDSIPAAALQVELLPAEAVAEDVSQQVSEGKSVVQGVELDSIGRIRGYHVRKVVNPTTGQYNGTPTFVPEAELLHLFREDFPGLLRGLPILSASLSRLRQLDLFEDAVLTKAQLSNLVVATVTGGDDLLPAEDEDGTVSLQPGTFTRLSPGESVNWQDPKAVDGASYETFVRAQLQAVAASLQMTYSDLTGDARDLTDRVVRVGRIDYQRFVDALVFQVVSPILQRIFDAWLDAAIEAKTLTLPAGDEAAHRRVEWISPRLPHFSPDQEANAIETSLRLGLTSRSALLAADGMDPEAMDAEIAADNTRADKLGLKFDGDGRGGKSAAPAGNGKPTDPNADPDNQDTQQPGQQPKPGQPAPAARR